MLNTGKTTLAKRYLYSNDIHVCPKYWSDSRNATEKARWKNLSPLTSQSSRCPSLAVTTGLGIQQCWDTLV
ncbi:hypothetical protein AAHA92_24010 [Salvia divinorum]|uniref:Uncharacterized protein n=1 Tax=Salvia divinorum TaxID=28513 RepID=A0ABD1G905_SALDI